ncbi:alpha/beta hydrolase family protein [Protaetiibacter larvae]|uniref:Alpha/beta fold hydrolase n=1 Tax=Protaetiibacter larvae TaxID=2592654 RepID=A0A5C1Y9S6_9MICO|nr:alpha/beta fold hydrolase [Protaetiibacter larvae]QEO10168.1 alpha/beta fold hydrolase [Protaetiibacter larvae]
MGASTKSARRPLAAIAGGLLGLGVLVAGVIAVLSAIVARTVVTPPSRREDDIRVLGLDVENHRITLSATEDSLLPGEYSFWFSGDSGHARVGQILGIDRGGVTRELVDVDFGDLAHAARGRFSGWFWLTPRDAGLPYENVAVPTPLGPAPAWFVPTDGDSERWVIQVHGRAVRRPETLRAVAPFREAGFHSLLISYRNDGEAPRSADYRYALGDREWVDVDAAMAYAIARGAREIVLMGWSMGGATVLQALTRSPRAALVSGVVLDSPVVDWIATLDFQGRLRRLPGAVRWGVYTLIRSRWGGLVTGLAEPLDLERLDFVRRAAELDRPVLLLHSVDDGFVPATASVALATARPDIVTFEEFTVARHTKLWNYDRTRWEDAIRNWLDQLSSQRA